MSACAVLLRGINVGRHNRLSMGELRSVLEAVGARAVGTYLQSGNAVVEAEPNGLAARIEDELRRRLGLEVRVLVRTAAELGAVVKANPFPGRVATPKQLHVAFLEAPAPAEVVRAVGTTHGADEYAVGDRVLYLSFAATSHDSPLNEALRRLGVVMTARNWTTVTRLLELAEGIAGGP
ncbi:MAG TPA: DUF1697 domain-containing protein [Mycobacteriales bacterium]|nr:DUF1697 domain-containing protein [Mycobacteriales bacterium]